MSYHKRSTTDRYSCKRWLALFVAVIILGMFTGCGAKENSYESVSGQLDTTVPEPEKSASETQEVVSADSPEDSQAANSTEKEKISGIEYGDMIRVSLTVQETLGVAEELGESEIVVANTSKEFAWPWPDELETDVEQAIGKYVGDTFSMWFEGGDGRYAYEFTILEIMDNDADIVEYGDRIQTSYQERCRGVDRPLPYGEAAGEAELIVSATDNQFHAVMEEYDRNRAEQNVLQALGKGVGDSFRVLMPAVEYDASREYTILGIDKAVKYGDRIKVSCRRISITTESEVKENTYDSIELPVWTNRLYTRLGENEAYEVETGKLFRELMGKEKGDTAWIAEETADKRTVYGLTILDVDKHPEGEHDLTGKEFILAEEENIEYIISDPGQQAFYAIVEDKANKKMYEYDLNDGTFIQLVCQYDYDRQYDEQGKLIREYSGKNDCTSEYQYSADGKLQETKTTTSNGNTVTRYYDSYGYIYKEELDFGDSRQVYEYESGICRKRTQYNADGTQDVFEFDEWGFLSDK